MFCRV